MSLILLGISHKTAPLDLREQLARTPGEIAVPHIVLATCNRIEVYAIAEEIAQVRPFFGSLSPEYCYAAVNEHAARHLFSVAAGLDSMILGEAQILGQVKQAYSSGGGEAILNRLFEAALATGKRARTETAINRYSISVSQAAIELAKRHFDDLASRRVLIVGVGEMGRKAAYALQGQAQITLINRTYARADEIAQQVGGSAVHWENLSAALREADIVITATGAPDPIIRPKDIDHPMLLIDLAVPRDVDPRVKNVRGVVSYDIDDLRQVIDRHYAERLACVPAVQTIIVEEVNTFSRWLAAREMIPTITDLRRKMEELAEAELETVLRQLRDLSAEDQTVIAQFTHRLVNKMLHEPTTRLKENAASGTDYSAAVRTLFDLKNP